MRDPLAMILSASAAALLASGCVGGQRLAVVAGPSFGADANGVTVSLEVSQLYLSKPTVRRDREGFARGIGIAATTTIGGAYQSNTGAFATGTIGFDYVPFHYSNPRGDRIYQSSLVGFGAHIGYAAPDVGLLVVAPRLWLEISAWPSGNASRGLGLMMRCRIPFDTDVGTTCGPALVASWVRLNGRAPKRSRFEVNESIESDASPDR